MKRVVVLAEPESLFLPNFVARVAERHPLAAILEVDGPSPRFALRRALRSFGPATTATIAASELAATLVDRLSSDRFYSLGKVAKRFGIPYERVGALHGAGCYGALERHRPDVVLTQVSRLVKPELLARGTFWNKHCALLPAYGGVFPVFWALLDQQPELGVTVHVMDEEFDRGPILQQATIRAAGHSFFSAYHALFDEAAELVERALLGLPNRVAPAESASYRSFPGRADRAAFRENGGRFGLAFRLHPRVVGPSASARGAEQGFSQPIG
jgi:hypothetical protein